MTAKILIRLAARIQAEASGDVSPTSDDDIYVTAPEHSSSVLRTEDQTSVNAYQTEQSNPSCRSKSCADICKGGEAKADIKVFSHNNPYAMLEQLSLEDSPQLDPAAATNLPPQPTKTAHRMMPDGNCGFWQRYGNRLRVNGTLEEVCLIW